MAAVTLLLFCALLYAAGAQDLPVDNVTIVTPLRSTGVDLALEYLHSKTPVRRLFRHYRTVDKQEQQPGGTESKFVYENLLLKPTVCLKGTVNPRQNCAFINNRPLMDCVVCYKTQFNQIQQTPEPYVHCIQKPKVTQEIRASRIQACQRMANVSGSTCLMCASIST